MVMWNPRLDNRACWQCSISQRCVVSSSLDVNEGMVISMNEQIRISIIQELLVVVPNAHPLVKEMLQTEQDKFEAQTPSTGEVTPRSGTTAKDELQEIRERIKDTTKELTAFQEREQALLLSVSEPKSDTATSEAEIPDKEGPPTPADPTAGSSTRATTPTACG